MLFACRGRARRLAGLAELLCPEACPGSREAACPLVGIQGLQREAVMGQAQPNYERVFFYLFKIQVGRQKFSFVCSLAFYYFM